MQPPVDPKPMTVSDAVTEYVIDQRVDEAVDALMNHPGNIDRAVDAMHDAFAAAFPVEVMVTAKPEPVQPAIDLKRRTSISDAEYAARVANMPEDVRLEIGTHYENLDITVDAICKEYSIHLGVLMAIVRDLGITRRRDRPDFRAGKRPNSRPGYFSLVNGKHIWMTGRKPTPQVRAYEKGLRDAQPALPSPPPKPPRAVQEPREPMPTLHTEYTDEPLWIVSLEASVEIRAERIEDVIVQTRIKFPHARIKGVTLA